MKLSIVIPTKNEEKYLPRLLRSIRQQTFKDYEIIVADNRSQDATREIAAEFGCRIVEGGLPAKARNKGAAIAGGKVILFLDADTKLKGTNFLQSLLDEFDRRNLDIAVPLAYVKGSRLDKLFYRFWNLMVEIFQYISPFAGGWCILAKREMHNKIKGFDEKIILGEDSDYAQRAAKVGKFGVIKSVEIEVFPRRLQKEGHLKVALQVVATGIYWLVKGKKDKKNRVGYKFDIYDK